MRRCVTSLRNEVSCVPTLTRCAACPRRTRGPSETGEKMLKIWAAIDEQIMQPFFAPNAHDTMNHSDTGLLHDSNIFQNLKTFNSNKNN